MTIGWGAHDRSHIYDVNGDCGHTLNLETRYWCNFFFKNYKLKSGINIFATDV